MAHTKIINYILSLKSGKAIVAILLYAVMGMSVSIVYLYKANVAMQEKAAENDKKYLQLYIDFYKNQNADMVQMRHKLDSTKVEFEIYKIKKKMK